MKQDANQTLFIVIELNIGPYLSLTLLSTLYLFLIIIVASVTPKTHFLHDVHAGKGIVLICKLIYSLACKTYAARYVCRSVDTPLCSSAMQVYAMSGAEHGTLRIRFAKCRSADLLVFIGSVSLVQ